MPATLKINEIFWSFQGEGLRFGRPSIFLRLSGCNLRCPFCDSPDSWQTPGQELPLPIVLERIMSLRRLQPASQLVITGGEPLLQDLTELVECARKAGFYMAIETNGTLFQDLDIDWWAVSPKPDDEYSIHPGLSGRIDEIKLVVSSGLGIGHIAAIRRRHPQVPIFLQPDVYNQGQAAYDQVFELFRLAGQSGIGELRAGMQLHRLYGVR